MGWVHHSVYPVYFEQARVEQMIALGIPYDQLEAEGILLPLFELHVNYRRPLRFGETFVVHSRMGPVTGVRLRVEYEIFCDDQLCVTGYTLHAFTGRNGRPIRPPNRLVQCLQSSFPG